MNRFETSSLLVLCVAAAAVIAGCATTPETTRTNELEDKPTGILQEDNEFIYLAKIKKETSAEDDRKVDVRSLKRKLPRSPAPAPIPPGVDRDRFLLEVVSYLGVRYTFGGTTKRGMDCSAFTAHVFRNALQKEIPRSTTEQYRIGDEIDRSDLQFGDLVFFNTTGRSPSHVGIYIEDDVFAHASVVEGVTLSSMESSYYKKRFIGARRILQ